ncbi:hypothetical protein D3C74_434370 [compost metagenome]
MPGFGRRDRRPDRFRIAHLPDQNNIRVLAKRCPEAAVKRYRIQSHLTLIDDRLIMAMQIFDRVLQRHDMLTLRMVDMVYQRGQSRRFPASGWAGNEKQALRLLGQLQQHGREM